MYKTCNRVQRIGTVTTEHFQLQQFSACMTIARYM